MTNNEILKTAFFECLLWASNDKDDDIPLDHFYNILDINSTDYELVSELCDKFIELAGDALLEKGFSQAGHDFFLTIAGHGAGFWDGDWPENGDRLTTICENLVSHIDIYEGDNGQVYIYISLRGEG